MTFEEEAPTNSVPAVAVRRGGQVLFGMTRRKGHVGGQYGPQCQATSSTGGMLGPIDLSKIEEGGISCVEIKFTDIRRNATSAGNLLGLY
jgi:hypothetical protein